MLVKFGTPKRISNNELMTEEARNCNHELKPTQFGKDLHVCDSCIKIIQQPNTPNPDSVFFRCEECEKDLCKTCYDKSTSS